MGRVDDCYFPSTTDVVPEELIWWSMPCLEACVWWGCWEAGEQQVMESSGGTLCPVGRRRASPCVLHRLPERTRSPWVPRDPASVVKAGCVMSWAARSCARLALVFLWVYQKEGLLLSGGMRGISGATVDGVFWHVIKSRCPRLDFLNEGFRPQTWQAANIVQLHLERKTCMDPSSKSILK